MKLDVVNECENPVLQRKEIVISVDNMGGPTPRKTEIVDKLSAQLNQDKELIVVKSIDQPFGSGIGQAVVKVYKDKAAKELAEPNPKKKEGEGQEGGAAPAEGGEAPSEGASAESGEAPSEAPAEQPKEESAAEEKPAEEPSEEASKGEAAAEEVKEEKPEGEQ